MKREQTPLHVAHKERGAPGLAHGRGECSLPRSLRRLAASSAGAEALHPVARIPVRGAGAAEPPWKTPRRAGERPGCREGRPAAVCLGRKPRRGGLDHCFRRQGPRHHRGGTQRTRAPPENRTSPGCGGCARVASAEGWGRVLSLDWVGKLRDADVGTFHTLC